MATKREMAERLKVLGEQLGTFFPTAGLNHTALEALLAEAEAKAAAAPQVSQERSSEPPALAEHEPGDPDATRYRVGRGALTSPRGILKPGEPLRPGDVTPDALKALLKAGLVVIDIREVGSEPRRSSGG